MNRILAGGAKGRRLASPRGLETRPTSSRVRQTLFDILQGLVPGCRFLDLFAGNGGVGLEALSRGAARVVLVDSAPGALAALRENVRTLSFLPGSVEVFSQDARVAALALSDAGSLFDIVYLDPPYASPLYEVLLETAGSLLLQGGQVVAEHFKKRPLPATIGGLSKTREVRVGDHCLSFYSREGA